MQTIIFYISSLGKGGAERVLLTVAEYLAEKYKVIILTDTSQKYEYTLPDKIVRLNMNNNKKCFGGRIGKILRREFRIRRYTRINQGDIIIGFSGKATIRMMIALFGVRITKIATMRTVPEWEFTSKIAFKIADKFFRKADTMVFQTAKQAESFSEKIQKKSHIIMNPVREDLYMERFIGVRNNEIVTVGRIDKNKNQLMLIEAFEIIKDTYPDLILNIYGEGEDREKLITQVKEKRLENRVFLPGSISDVTKAIYQSKVFVLTSECEGIPNALMEAMSLGVPVISTDCIGGGPGELIQDGVNGFLIPRNDIKALVDKLHVLLQDEELGNNLGKNAQDIQKILQPEKICKKWEECIMSVYHKRG